MSSPCSEKMEVATRHSGLPVEGSGARSASPMWQPQVVQKKRSQSASACLYAVRELVGEEGEMNSGWTPFGSGAWKMHRVP